MYGYTAHPCCVYMFEESPVESPGNVVQYRVPYGTEMAVARQPVGFFSTFFSVSDFSWHGLVGSIKN